MNESTSQAVNTYKAALSNFKLIESRPTTLSGNPAQLLVYSYNDPVMGATQGMVAATIKGDKLYLVTYIARSAKFPVFLPSVQIMLKSFAFTPSDSNFEIKKPDCTKYYNPPCNAGEQSNRSSDLLPAYTQQYEFAISPIIVNIDEQASNRTGYYYQC